MKRFFYFLFNLKVYNRTIGRAPIIFYFCKAYNDNANCILESRESLLRVNVIICIISYTMKLKELSLHIFPMYELIKRYVKYNAESTYKRKYTARVS